jgi:4-amino-4-deoxy-L-arabinose transferase-like glycosyltransferase
MAVYAFRHWLKNPTWKQTILAGLALGLLPLAKITWIIAFPLWIVIWLCWLLMSRTHPTPKPGGKQMVVLLGIALYLLHTGYLFDGSFRTLGDYEFISRTFSGTDTPPGNRFRDSWIAALPVPFPGEFMQGIDTQKLDFERGLESYFRGAYSQHGWWYYYLYTVLVKEPLATLLLGGLALVTSLRRSGNAGATRRDEMVVLLPCLAVFVVVSSQTGFSLHPRYIIPALPFAYIGISRLARSFTERRRVLATATMLLLLWMVGSSLYYFPHSMSYFNELIGPNNGPKHLLGSNVDWGQNSYFLKTWYDAHPEARPIRIAYTPTEPFERLGIDAEIPSGDLEPGWYVIGANELYGPGDLYKAFRSLEPVDRIGMSLWIYHIEPEAMP